MTQYLISVWHADDSVEPVFASEEDMQKAFGQVGAFKGGVFLVAIDAGLPVVPLSVDGTRHVMRKGRLMTCPGDVTLTIHAPIPTTGMTRADARALAATVQQVVAADVNGR